MSIITPPVPRSKTDPPKESIPGNWFHCEIPVDSKGMLVFGRKKKVKVEEPINEQNDD